MIIIACKLHWKSDSLGIQAAKAPDGGVYLVAQATDPVDDKTWGWSRVDATGWEEVGPDRWAESEETAKAAAQYHWNERCIGFLDKDRLEKVTLAYQRLSDVVRQLNNTIQALTDANKAALDVENDTK